MFSSHRADTVDKITRIEAIFEQLDLPPTERDCPIMEGVLAETDALLSQVETDALRDLDVIGIGILNERIEITLLDRLLVVARPLDHPPAITDRLDANRSEAVAALEQLQDRISSDRWC